MTGRAARRASAPNWAALVARALVVLSIRRLPEGAAARYLEECEADLGQLEHAGHRATLAHALALLCVAPRLETVVSGPSARNATSWLRAALAHFGLASAPRPASPGANGAYVFAGSLRWRPLERRKTLERTHPRWLSPPPQT